MDTLSFEICVGCLEIFIFQLNKWIYELRSQEKYRCEIMIWKLSVCVGETEVKTMTINEKNDVYFTGMEVLFPLQKPL